MNADLTIAICMYNASPYIEVTLQSVLAQSMQDFHLLIVDDCSTDDSVEKVVAFFAKTPRQYELVRLEQNQGIGHARHFAERHASTQYMMFLDADDVLYPHAIATMYRTITSDPDLMAVGCYLEYVDTQGKKMGGGLFLGCKTKDEFYDKAAGKKLFFMQPTAIYDRQLALSVGGYVISGYPDGKPRYQDFCEDLDLWTRMSDLYTQGKAIVVVPEVLCKYRKGSGLSSNSFNMIIKMRYVKQNLLRRRAGEKELSFIEFRDSLSAEEMRRLEKESAAADALRRGFFLLKQRKFVPAVGNILKSVWLQPGYLWQKILNNSGIFKK